MDNDVFGQLIENFYRGKNAFSVVERDDGYINVDEGADLYLADYRDWESHEKKAIKYAKGRFLDIGCGAGRVMLYLQKKGFSGIGIDTSPKAIKICRLRGTRKVKIMDIEEVGKFKRGSFDTILMFGYNFGLFASRKKAKALLKKLFRITSNNAVIIAEDRDPYMTSNPINLKYLETNSKKGRMPGQLRLRVRFMQYSSSWFDYLYVSKKEMINLLKGTGWKIERFIDSNSYEKNGRYMGIIVKKK